MPERPIYLASDIHLGAVPASTERSFLGWLEQCGGNASRVILNGDLFDFWFEYRSVIPRGHTRVLGALARLVDGGVPVLIMGGNHDWWGGSFLREEIGVDFRQAPITLDLQGRRTLLAHGDGLGAGDLGYRVLRFLLRGSPTRAAFRWLHPDLGAGLARRVSRTPDRTASPLPAQISRSRFLEEWAEGQLRSAPDLDLVVLGHTHIPVLKEVDAGRFYLNAGDWIVHRSYAVLQGREPPQILRWEKD